MPLANDLMKGEFRRRRTLHAYRWLRNVPSRLADPEPQVVDEFVREGSDNGRTGNREDPCDHNPASKSPSDSGDPLCCSDAHDGPGYRVRCADRDSAEGRDEKRNSTRRFGTETARRFQFRHLLPHGLDDPPTAEQRPERNREVAADDDPPGHFEGFQNTRRHEKSGDHSHRFLSIIGSVSKAIERC